MIKIIAPNNFLKFKDYSSGISVLEIETEFPISIAKEKRIVFSRGLRTFEIEKRYEISISKLFKSKPAPIVK